MKPSLAAPMRSQSLPVQAWDRADIFRFINMGRQMNEPLPLEDGRFYYPQGGAYQLFCTAAGHRVGIWAADPDDLVTGSLVVDDAMAESLQMEGADGQAAAVPVGTRLERRLLDKGDGNLDRLRVFTLRPRASVKKWLHDEMNRHQQALLSFTEDYGTLYRQSPTRWISDGVVYQLEETKTKGRYDLYMTAAPGYGWRLGREYDRLFTGLSGQFIRKASLRDRDMTLEEAEKKVQEDFAKRAPLFIDGLDPYSVLLNGEAQKAASWSYTLHKHHLNAVHALSQMKPSEIGKTLGTLAIGNGALLGASYALGFPVSPLVSMGKVVGQTASNTGKRVFEYARLKKAMLEEDGIVPLLQMYTKDWNEKQLWGSKLNPEIVPHLRALTHDELDTDLAFDGRIYAELPVDLSATEYVYGVLQGPAGSLATPFGTGADLKGIRVDETGGLSVEYFPERKVCFARLDMQALKEENIPNAVIELFERAPDGAPYLKIAYDDATRTLKTTFLSPESYALAFDAVCAQPPLPPRKPCDDGIRLVPPSPPAPKHWWQRLVGEGLGEGGWAGLEDAAENAIGGLPLGGPKLH